MNDSFRKALFLEETDHQELMHILLGYFGRSESQELNIRKYKKRDSDFYLTLKFDDNGRITELLEHNLTESLWTEISSAIKHALIDNQTPYIGQTVAFTYERVDGYFKYRNLFQLIPVPENAPRPDFAAADHPFLIEYAYVSSPNIMVDQQRKSQKVTTYLRILNIFVRNGVKAAPRYSQHNWTLCFDRTTKKLTSKFKQEGYAYEGFLGKKDAFSPSEGLQMIKLITWQDYYKEPHGISSDALTLPDNLDHSLDLALSLSPHLSKRFSLSIALLEQARRVWGDSHSLSYVAHINAIEALIEAPSKKERCEKCGREKEGPTARFRDFLKKFFPALEDFKEEKDLIYTVRSNINHGVTLMEQDIAPWNFLMSIRAQKDHSLFGNVSFIVATAVRNWLWSQ